MDNGSLVMETAPLGSTSAATPTLAAEVRATALLFGMVLLVILGFGLASTLVLRLLAS